MGLDTAVCSIIFDAPADPQEVLHTNIPIDSDRISLNQYCKDDSFGLIDSLEITESEMGCMPYELNACDYDMGNCIHNHQEEGVKSYVRCGVTRPFETTASAL